MSEKNCKMYSWVVAITIVLVTVLLSLSLLKEQERVGILEHELDEKSRSIEFLEGHLEMLGKEVYEVRIEFDEIMKNKEGGKVECM